MIQEMMMLVYSRVTHRMMTTVASGMKPRTRNQTTKTASSMVYLFGSNGRTRMAPRMMEQNTKATSLMIYHFESNGRARQKEMFT
jgi:hypothetical protein